MPLRIQQAPRGEETDPRQRKEKATQEQTATSIALFGATASSYNSEVTTRYRVACNEMALQGYSDGTCAVCLTLAMKQTKKIRNRKQKRTEQRRMRRRVIPLCLTTKIMSKAFLLLLLRCAGINTYEWKHTGVCAHSLRCCPCQHYRTFATRGGGGEKTLFMYKTVKGRETLISFSGVGGVL